MTVYTMDKHIFFGDTWKIICYLLEESKRLGQPLGLFCPNEKYKKMAKEILDELDSTGLVALTDQRPTVSKDYRLRAPVVPTKIRWDALGEQGAYQFDGVSHGAKNPPLKDQQWFLNEMTKLEIKMVCLGKHLSVKDCVQEASRSRFFIGCDSGMAQLCYSVGVPAHVLNWYDPPSPSHPHGFNDFSWHLHHAGRAASRPKSLHEFVEKGFKNPS